MTTMKASKSVLRKEIGRKLASLTTEQKSKQSKEVAQKLFNLPEFSNSQRISVFLSMDCEISTNSIVERILAENKLCFVPRCYRNSMDMVKLKSIDDFRQLPINKWGIKEPRVDEERENALHTGGLDMVIVPGLAFNDKGARLGRGLAFYDRFFESIEAMKLPKPKKIAVAFKEQILDDIPTESHDFNVDLVLYCN